MSENNVQLRAAFDRFKQLAERRTWVPSPPAPIEVRLTSFDSPTDVPVEAVVAFVRHLENTTGIALRLTGGGYGCFDLGFTADLPSSGLPGAAGEALEAAITTDPETQRILNDLPTHVVRGRTAEASYSFRAYNVLKIAIATNRDQIRTTSTATEDIRGLFGGAPAKKTTYGLADVLISDLSKCQPKESLAKRIWRGAKAPFGSGAREPKIIVGKLDLYDQSEIASAVGPLVRKGVVVVVHGYANSFDQAINTCALGVHRARFPDLQLLPVLFSWPAQANLIKYAPDSNAAENSEMRLLEALDLFSSVARDKPLSVIAHSHGNKLLVRSLTTAVKDRLTRSRWLKRLVLIEPDVDQGFLEERAALLADASERIVLYHSANDRALKIASILFESVRAGMHGIRVEEVDRLTADRLEIIDASSVAQGWTKHAPHIDSPEVIADLYYLFQGQPPADRHSLRQNQAARWTITPVLER